MSDCEYLCEYPDKKRQQFYRDDTKCISYYIASLYNTSLILISQECKFILLGTSGLHFCLYHFEAFVCSNEIFLKSCREADVKA